LLFLAGGGIEIPLLLLFIAVLINMAIENGFLGKRPKRLKKIVLNKLFRFIRTPLGGFVIGLLLATMIFGFVTKELINNAFVNVYTCVTYEERADAKILSGLVCYAGNYYSPCLFNYETEFKGNFIVKQKEIDDINYAYSYRMNGFNSFFNNSFNFVKEFHGFLNEAGEIVYDIN
jgi:hypothetical protein